MLTRDVAGAFFPRRFQELRGIDQEITSYCFAVPGWRSRSHSQHVRLSVGLTFLTFLTSDTCRFNIPLKIQ